MDTNLASGVAAEINQALDELGVRDKVEVKVKVRRAETVAHQATA